MMKIYQKLDLLFWVFFLHIIILVGIVFYYNDVKNIQYINTALLFDYFIFLVLVLCNIVIDFREIKTDDKLHILKQGKSFIFFLVRIVQLIGKIFWKYAFFALHSLLLYAIFIKIDIRFVAVITCVLLFLPMIVFYNSSNKKNYNNTMNSKYIWLSFVNALAFSLYITNYYDEIDKAVFENKEKIIAEELALCNQEQCEKWLIQKDKNNVFAQQKYSVHINNDNGEKCISIYNMYLEPNLYMSKCGDREIEVDYIGEKYNQ